MLSQEKIEEILKGGCFGGWITAFWQDIVYALPNFSFPEHKEAFFWLLEKLLREGKVAFSPPSDPLCKKGRRWDAPVEEIIEYLRKSWPETAKDENDSDLNLYFYTIPSIAWLGEDGEWHGS